MALKLKGSTSGFTAIDAPAVAGDNTLVLPGGNGTAHQVLKNSATAGTLEYGLTLPSGNGSSGQYLQSDGTGGSSWQTVTDTTGWTWDTTGDTLSGESSVSITGIPSTAKQIIATVRDLSCANDINWGMRAGTSSGVVSSGYESHGWYVNISSSNSTGTSTTDWSNFGGAAASFVFNGRAVLTNLTGNVWFCEGVFNIQTSYNTVHLWQGHVELSDTLDRVEFHPGSGTFDSGTVFVHYFTP